MPGTWSVGDVGKRTQRPGVYTRFLAELNLTVTSGARGVVAVVGQAGFGPVGRVIRCENISDYINQYLDWYDTNTSRLQEFDPYLAVRNAFVGGAFDVLFYRVDGTGEDQATVTVNNGSDIAVLDITAKYAGTLGNLMSGVLSKDASDVVSFTLSDAAGNLLINYSADLPDATPGLIDEIIDYINTSEENIWINAARPSAFTTNTITDNTVADNTSYTLSGGLNPAPADSNWIDALDALAQDEFTHVYFCIDPSDSAFDLVVAQVVEMREEGKNVVLVTGSEEDDTASVASTDAIAIDNEGVVFVHPGFIDYDRRYGAGEQANNFEVSYPGAVVSARLAGLLARTPLTQSVTKRSIPGSIVDLNVRNNNRDIADMLDAGVMVLAYDGRNFKIEKGINTLSAFTANKPETFSKIKIMSILDAIQSSIDVSLDRQVIGKVLNNRVGRRVVISAIRTFFNGLAASDVIEPDFIVEQDPDNAPTKDRFFIRYAVKPIDTIDYVYNTAQVNT